MTNLAHVVWLSYHAGILGRGYWDQGTLEELLARLGYPPHRLTLVHHDTIGDVPEGEGAIVVIPGRHHAADIERIASELDALAWAIVVVTGDEESTFDWLSLRGEHRRMWIMHPDAADRAEQPQGVTFLGSGAPPRFTAELRAMDGPPERDLPLFLAGQATTDRRREAMAAAAEIEGAEVIATAGFTQGVDSATYARGMARARIAPCPSGPVAPDSFRLFEALEAGALPIADARVTRDEDLHDYWPGIFGETPPFPFVDQWEQLGEVVDSAAQGWPANANAAAAWWQWRKRTLTRRMAAQLESFGVSAPGHKGELPVTFVVVTSPIPSHPSTAIIEETVRSLFIAGKETPAELLILIDGVRPEQEHLRDVYETYVSRLLWLCAHRWRNVTPLRFEEHRHQSGMMIAALAHISTPLVVFVEHDTPVIGEVPWTALGSEILDGRVDLIRLHHEASILKPHRHLMLGPVANCSVPLQATMQWSQRPHLASTDFYRRIMAAHFSPDDATMIEDVMHGVVQSFIGVGGRSAWSQYRLAIYAPKGDIKRSTHLDGRGDEPKYDMLHRGRVS